MPVFKYTDNSGRTVYSDRPPGQSDVQQPNTQAAERQRQADDYRHGRELVNEAKKRIPKLNDYLEYLQYLRNWRPRDYNVLLQKLRKTDGQAYAKLMKYPQFRPRGEVALGGKASEKLITASIGAATGNFRGTFEKWLETTVKESMERDGWSPKVLGSRATTLPARPPTTYSNSRLGQYLKVEDARAAKAAANAARSVRSADGALRAARGSVATRFLGPFIDLGLNLLNRDTAQSVAHVDRYLEIRKLYEKGVLDEEQWAEAQQMNSQGRFADLDRYIESAKQTYVSGGR